jgi:hypothetical protein
MISSLETPKGTIILRDASLADADAYRELRLFALQESPTAFSADYEKMPGIQRAFGGTD